MVNLAIQASKICRVQKFWFHFQKKKKHFFSTIKNSFKVQISSECNLFFAFTFYKIDN